MSSCNFCQKQDDTRNMKIYKACEMSYGKPCGPCTEYLELEAQIEETRKILEEQLERRHKIRKKINRVHDTMLIRVPPEITAYIFELAASIDIPPHGSRVPLEGELYAPLPLGKVCGAWRNIAWDIPQLWTFMRARISTIEDFPSRFDVAKQWLSRSGDKLPLSIHFRLHENPEDPEDPFWKWREYIPFINLLNLYSHRWKNFCGLAPSWLFWELSANSQGAPMLQYLQITTTPVMEEMTFDLGCEPLPQPRSVGFYDVYLPDLHINWSHVTRLETNTLMIPHFLEELPQLHELTDLRVSGAEVLGGYQPRSFTLLKLESLYIKCPDRNQLRSMCSLLDSLILPSLRHLEIKLFQNIDMITAAATLIQRSSCKLSTLSLSCCPLSSQNSLKHLLKRASSIEELEICDILEYDGNFLKALQNLIQHRNDHASQPLPLSNLRRLTYLPEKSSMIPWKLLLLIFDPRWGANLKTLSIPFLSPPLESQTLVNKDLEFDILRGLLDLLEAGIELFLPRKITTGDVLNVIEEKADA